MKRDGRAVAEAEIYESVVAELAEQSGHPRERITPWSRIAEDLGVYGDDAYEVICRVDDAFEMAPGDFHVGIHFGIEGLGAPLPWHLTNSAASFQPQPMTVAEVVAAVKRGRWPDTPRILAPRSRLVSLYLASWLQFALLAGGLILVLVMVMARMLGGL